MSLTSLRDFLPKLRTLINALYQGSSQGIGTVYTDSIYTPIEKISYNVEPTRVGQDAKYDRLVFEIWTDGSISPESILQLTEFPHVLNNYKI